MARGLSRIDANVTGNAMSKEALLEPFAPHMLTAIRTAFQACWNELPRDLTADVTHMRNRLACTIANLASKGILDPHELKSLALNTLGIGASPLAGGTSNGGRDG